MPAAVTGGPRVGVDATTWANPRGFGRFTRHSISSLVERDDRTSYVLYVGGPGPPSLPPGAAVRAVRLRGSPGDALSRGGTRSLGDIARLTAAASRDRLDAFVFTSPLGYFPVVGTPTIVGLHDTTAIDHPDLVFTSGRARLAASAKSSLAIRRATCLFTVSESARIAIADRLRLSADRLPVVGEAAAPVFHPRTTPECARRLAPLDLRPPEPFLLYAGGINPHKNLGTLVDAYAALWNRREDVPPLVIAGDPWDSYVSAGRAVAGRIAARGLGAAVRFVGYVPDEVLACLYSAARAVVVPSMAEGFGLSAVEAAACGAPVVASDLPAHHETLGNGALYFAPTDARALAGHLARLLDDEAHRRAVAALGRRQAGRFSWDATAERLAAVIRGVLQASRGRRSSPAPP